MIDRDEVKRLKKENHDLKKKLYKLEMESHAEDESGDGMKDCFGATNYFSYLLAKMRRKNGFSTFEKYFKNSLWITSILRWGVLIYQYLQAGAFMILYTAAFILVIPVILVISALTLALTLILRSHNASLLLKEAKRNILFIIPNSKENFNRMFLRQIAEEHKTSTVLIVSPFFLKRHGIGESNKMYVCFRKESDNVFILRNYFFFYFRKRLKKEQRFEIKEIHTLGRKKI
ncbi:MAG: hypothetical protein IJA60_05895 [Clostridia bacterium]|nr:hypothetical protein [Clostridia bacterium]